METKIVNNIRILGAELPNIANSGHPGAPMGLAAVAHTLFSRIMIYDPSDPTWIGRDRFILSNGHGSALLYTMLHVSGFESMTRDQLMNFRQLHSLTPGHPEFGHTPGVEVTTGPLGQGLANAVGMAIAQKMIAKEYPEAPLGHFIYTILGDGCMQEGVQSEASSLAGHLGLDNLIAIYDDNHITIDGSTDVSFTEEVGLRFTSYGWEVLHLSDANTDVDAIEECLRRAQLVKGKPVLIIAPTKIGFGAKTEGTAKVHGSPIGAEDLHRLKSEWGLPMEPVTQCDELTECYAGVRERLSAQRGEWDTLWTEFETKNPRKAADLIRRKEHRLPEIVLDALADLPWNGKIATRSTSHQVLNTIAHFLPEFVGGSADLTGSNKTELGGLDVFQRHSAGRQLRFGVREHGMAAIVNGIAAYGLHLPFGATFEVFAGYMLGAMRVAALSHYPAIYVLTHDSIGVGEDGPTHQPVETLDQLRSMPNMLAFRPADGRETAGAYMAALQNLYCEKPRPCAMAMSRQNLPQLSGSDPRKVILGGYILKEEEEQLHNILVATGSEVELALEVAGPHTRVISVPCLDLLLEQSIDYLHSLFTPGVPAVAVEAGVSRSWYGLVHGVVGVDRYGLSAPASQVFEQLGVTAQHVSEKLADVTSRYGTNAPDLISMYHL